MVRAQLTEAETEIVNEFRVRRELLRERHLAETATLDREEAERMRSLPLDDRSDLCLRIYR